MESGEEDEVTEEKKTKSEKETNNNNNNRKSEPNLDSVKSDEFCASRLVADC